jgi:dGTPase
VASPELAEQKHQLEAFLRKRVYRHPAVLTHRLQAQAALRAMFDGYIGQPGLLPERFRQRLPLAGPRRTVADYLAGMTDRFAQREFARLFAGGSRGTGSS